MTAPRISFEFFPPQTLDASFKLWETVQMLAPLKPEFVSVTYGAGGTTRKLTHDAVTTIAKNTGLNVAAHLTCVDATKAETLEIAAAYTAAGITDMRRGFDGLAAIVQEKLAADPFSGHVFIFRGRRGDIVKLLWFDGQGLMLLAKRLERGRFVWPQATSGSVSLTPAQLSMLLEGIDWRMPVRTQEPQLAA